MTASPVLDATPLTASHNPRGNHMHYRITITPDTEREYGINTGRRIICGRIRNRTERQNHTNGR